MKGKTYVIYYGWLTDDPSGEPNADARRIARGEPPLLIAHLWTAPPQRHKNLSAQVLGLMHAAGTEVFAYVATTFGTANPASLKAQIDEALDAGVDGILFDEVDPLAADAKLGYYRTLSGWVRERGKTVILNTGMAACGQRIMDVTDRLMVEHQWRNLGSASPWTCLYRGERLMGVSSEEGRAMGYSLDLETALRDTREAWQAGVGWHASTQQFVALPSWFESYIGGLKASD